MSLVAQGRVLWLFPKELLSPSLWAHCSSSLSPPTKTAQSQIETKAPLAEGMWGDKGAQGEFHTVVYNIIIWAHNVIVIANNFIISNFFCLVYLCKFNLQ